MSYERILMQEKFGGLPCAIAPTLNEIQLKGAEAHRLRKDDITTNAFDGTPNLVIYPYVICSDGDTRHGFYLVYHSKEQSITIRFGRKVSAIESAIADIHSNLFMYSFAEGGYKEVNVSYGPEPMQSQLAAILEYFLLMHTVSNAMLPFLDTLFKTNQALLAEGSEQDHTIQQLLHEKRQLAVEKDSFEQQLARHDTDLASASQRADRLESDVERERREADRLREKLKEEEAAHKQTQQKYGQLEAVHEIQKKRLAESEKGEAIAALAEAEKVKADLETVVADLREQLTFQKDLSVANTQSLNAMQAAHAALEERVKQALEARRVAEIRALEFERKSVDLQDELNNSAPQSRMGGLGRMLTDSRGKRTPFQSQSVRSIRATQFRPARIHEIREDSWDDSIVRLSASEFSGVNSSSLAEEYSRAGAAPDQQRPPATKRRPEAKKELFGNNSVAQPLIFGSDDDDDTPTGTTAGEPDKAPESDDDSITQGPIAAASTGRLEPSTPPQSRSPKNDHAPGTPATPTAGDQPSDPHLHVSSKSDQIIEYLGIMFEMTAVLQKLTVYTHKNMVNDTVARHNETLCHIIRAMQDSLKGNQKIDLDSLSRQLQTAMKCINSVNEIISTFPDVDCFHVMFKKVHGFLEAYVHRRPITVFYGNKDARTIDDPDEIYNEAFATVCKALREINGHLTFYIRHIMVANSSIRESLMSKLASHLNNKYKTSLRPVGDGQDEGLLFRGGLAVDATIADDVHGISQTATHISLSHETLMSLKLNADERSFKPAFDAIEIALMTLRTFTEVSRQNDQKIAEGLIVSTQQLTEKLVKTLQSINNPDPIPEIEQQLNDEIGYQDAELKQKQAELDQLHQKGRTLRARLDKDTVTVRQLHETCISTQNDILSGREYVLKRYLHLREQQQDDPKGYKLIDEYPDRALKKLQLYVLLSKSAIHLENASYVLREAVKSTTSALEAAQDNYHTLKTTLASLDHGEDDANIQSIEHDLRQFYAQSKQLQLRCTLEQIEDELRALNLDSTQTVSLKQKQSDWKIALTELQPDGTEVPSVEGGFVAVSEAAGALLENDPLIAATKLLREIQSHTQSADQQEAELLEEIELDEDLNTKSQVAILAEIAARKAAIHYAKERLEQDSEKLATHKKLLETTQQELNGLDIAIAEKSSEVAATSGNYKTKPSDHPLQDWLNCLRMIEEAFFNEFAFSTIKGINKETFTEYHQNIKELEHHPQYHNFTLTPEDMEEFQRICQEFLLTGTATKMAINYATTRLDKMGEAAKMQKSREALAATAKQNAAAADEGRKGNQNRKWFGWGGSK